MPKEKYIEYYLTYPNANDIYGQTCFVYPSYEKTGIMFSYLELSFLNQLQFS